MSPSGFTPPALRADIEVKTEEIQAGRGAAPRARWYVIGYREHENRKGFVPERESEFTNLFLVSEVEWTGEQRGKVKGQYLVVESWRYHLAQGVKTCHQWVIWERDLQTAPARASFRFLAEDFDNVLLGERVAPLDPQTLQRLEDFYLEIKPLLVERAKPSPAGLTRGVSFPVGRPARPPWIGKPAQVCCVASSRMLRNPSFDQAAQEGPDARRHPSAMGTRGGVPSHRLGQRRTPGTPQRVPERANAANGPFSAAG